MDPKGERWAPWWAWMLVLLAAVWGVLLVSVAGYLGWIVIQGVHYGVAYLLGGVLIGAAGLATIGPALSWLFPPRRTPFVAAIAPAAVTAFIAVAFAVTI